MMDDRSHPLLQQTPLSVNPFIDLPKAPTLPHNYATIPSTIPPSILNAAPAPSNPELPAYVTSASGSFAAHPQTIIAQNNALLEQLEKQKVDGQREVEEWERRIKERELAEKRRKAPGYLDSDVRVLEPQPAKPSHVAEMGDTANQVSQPQNLMDDPEPTKQGRSVDDLGDAMDRAFGRSEMG
ncbi:unnamed protein product [Zymoseptoria tritici ST99CH_3D1]|nr:unnamed protein product [Zymoseptoria tritici ST99CH_3D1]